MLGTESNKIIHVRYAASALILTRFLPSTSQLSPKLSTLSSCFLNSLFWLSRVAYNSLTSVSSRSIVEFTSESLSDPGEEPECVGVACPPEDARAPLASPAMVQKLLRRPAAKQRPMKPVASL